MPHPYPPHTHTTPPPHPCRVPSDASLDKVQRVSRMLRRTVAAEYSFPSGDDASSRPTSEGLRDLIARILVVDPAQRLTLQQIQAHPWFTQGLEPGALQFNDAIVQESLANQPTQEILSEVCAWGRWLSRVRFSSEEGGAWPRVFEYKCYGVQVHEIVQEARGHHGDEGQQRLHDQQRQQQEEQGALLPTGSEGGLTLLPGFTDLAG